MLDTARPDDPGRTEILDAGYWMMETQFVKIFNNFRQTLNPEL
jgi:hypothetical protein